MKLTHCPTYDKYGVTLTQWEQITANETGDGITLGIGADPLTRKDITLTREEAARLADWIYMRLEQRKHTR